MPRYPARLFGPGLAAGGEAVELELSDLRLTVVGRADADAPLTTVQLKLAGFNLDEWQLAWGDAARFVAHIADRAALARLAAAPPTGLKSQVVAMTASERRRGHRATLVWSVLAFILLSPLIMLGVFIWQADRVIDWAVEQIPVEQEKKLGELVFATQAAGLKLVEQGPAADAVRQIGARLTQGSRYAYQFKLVETPEVNAFAVPGGIVVVNTGLLAKATSAEEVAGVLAHEVQHVERRHSLRAAVNDLGLIAMISLLLGDPSGAAAGAVQQLAGLSFSRDQETDADLRGLDTLRRAGIAPDGMLRFYRGMADGEGAALPAWLSTHPASEARFATLETALREKGQWTSTPLPYDWKAIVAELKK